MYLHSRQSHAWTTRHNAKSSALKASKVRKIWEADYPMLRQLMEEKIDVNDHRSWERFRTLNVRGANDWRRRRWPKSIAEEDIVHHTERELGWNIRHGSRQYARRSHVGTGTDAKYLHNRRKTKPTNWVVNHLPVEKYLKRYAPATYRFWYGS